MQNTETSWKELNSIRSKSSSNPSALAFLGVLNLRKVQTKDTSFFALKMEKSGPRTAAKPLRSPIFLENAVFLLKKHEIAAFVLVDKSGYFYGCGGRIRTNDLRVMREDKSLAKNRENLEISTKSRIYY